MPFGTIRRPLCYYLICYSTPLMRKEFGKRREIGFGLIEETLSRDILTNTGTIKGGAGIPAKSLLLDGKPL